MNFSANQSDANNLEFEVILDEATGASVGELPAKPATAVLVIIPRGIKFKVDVDSYPGATCVRIPVGASA